MAASPRPIGIRQAAAVCCVSFALLGACTSQSSPSASGPAQPSVPGSASPSGTTPRAPKHQALAGDPPIVVIFMENHDESAVVGSSSAQYETSLVQRGRSYTNYFAIAHPSLPNYLAFASGSTHGKTDDNVTAGEFGGPTLWTQLSAAGVHWAVYEESMPSPCFTQYSAGSAPGDYALKHDPAMPFRSITTDHTACEHVQPLTQMNTR